MRAKTILPSQGLATAPDGREEAHVTTWMIQHTLTYHGDVIHRATPLSCDRTTHHLPLVVVVFDVLQDLQGEGGEEEGGRRGEGGGRERG